MASYTGRGADHGGKKAFKPAHEWPSEDNDMPRKPETRDQNPHGGLMKKPGVVRG